MSHRWLILRLEAPLMAFGGVAVDHVGPTRLFPAASALAGLFGNALGWDWADRDAHQDLQDRMIFASALTREGAALTDNQNARVYNQDIGWTTFGEPEGREGGVFPFREKDGRTYMSHRRRRDYLADAAVTVALRVTEGTPDLDTLAHALSHPVRPLFIGRKPCLPSRPIFDGWTEADTAHAALIASGAQGLAEWPQGEGPALGSGSTRAHNLPDRRNWRSGLHGGARVVHQGVLP